jgi:2-dehydro-3-deoxyphosphogluconate aldolase/(4S)-4-hydroxy-2-oxoglutarate aldolase
MHPEGSIVKQSNEDQNMPQNSRLKVLTTMIETGLVPVFYHPDPEVAINVINACLDGGVHCFEFTNRGDRAHEVFSQIITRMKLDTRLILGTGSVLEAATAALYIQLGSNFIVGPNLNPDVARLCNRRRVAYSPGCGSVSEISQAEELGVEICKIFPGSSVGGPEFVKDLLGPMPWTRIMPTGGVDASEESISSWIKAGVACLGMGSKLLPPEVIASGDYAQITNKVKDVIELIKMGRGKKNPI